MLCAYPVLVHVEITYVPAVYLSDMAGTILSITLSQQHSWLFLFPYRPLSLLLKALLSVCS